MKEKPVLIIDDDAVLAGFLARFLEKYGFKLSHAGNVQDGLRAIELHKPVAVLLDINLPGGSGLDLCRKIRERNPVPIIMISSLGESSDKVLGLQLGADHYLPKPFEPRELVAHLEAVLRRASHAMTPAGNELIQLGGLEVDVSRRQVSVDGKLVEISSAEFDLLRLFVSRPGHVFDRDEILDALKGVEWDAYNRSIDVIVSRLRKRLGDDTKQPRFLKTVRGAGYLFLPQEAARKAG